MRDSFCTFDFRNKSVTKSIFVSSSYDDLFQPEEKLVVQLSLQNSTQQKKFQYHQHAHGLDIENASIFTSICQKYIGWLYFALLLYVMLQRCGTVNTMFFTPNGSPKVIRSDCSIIVPS